MADVVVACVVKQTLLSLMCVTAAVTRHRQQLQQPPLLPWPNYEVQSMVMSATSGAQPAASSLPAVATGTCPSTEALIKSRGRRQ